MDVIGVLDLLAGRAVHARAGTRERYAPVQEIAGSPVEGDAVALARAYVGRFGVTELYAADLDAIMGGTPQDTLVTALAALGAPLWLDAGVSSSDRARDCVSLGAARVILGLETLSSYGALAGIGDAIGGDRVAFSLDLREGEPVVALDGIVAVEPAHVIAAKAADSGVGAIIVIDLARVGTGRGLDLDVLARVRAAAPRAMLLAGGGVRGPADLERLADAGCDAALVATAMLDGRLTAADVAAAGRHAYRSPRR